MIENSLWVERYRPKTLNEYVGNDDIKKKVQVWLDQGDIPNLLFFGPAGTGKTSLAKIIGKTLDADVMYINTSDENSVDVIRDKIKGFASTSGFSKWKIVILDEADFATANFQAALRNTLETFSKHTRFILTCNFIEKIIDPIQSRLVSFHVIPPDKKSVAIRCAQILKSENITYNPKDVIALIDQYYPDQRRIIQSLQRNSVSGELVIDEQFKMVSGYCEKVLEQLKSNFDVKQTFNNIRQIIADSKVRQFDDLFRYLFDNLEEFAPDGKRAQMILHIADAQNKANLVVDKEIQVAAMFVNILRDLK